MPRNCLLQLFGTKSLKLLVLQDSPKSPPWGKCLCFLGDLSCSVSNQGIVSTGHALMAWSLWDYASTPSLRFCHVATSTTNEETRFKWDTTRPHHLLLCFYLN